MSNNQHDEVDEDNGGDIPHYVFEDTRQHRRRIRADFDLICEVFEERTGMKVNEAVDALRWIQKRKSFGEKLAAAGAFSLITLAVTGAAAAMWEAVKFWVRMLKGMP